MKSAFTLTITGEAPTAAEILASMTANLMPPESAIPASQARAAGWCIPREKREDTPPLEVVGDFHVGCLMIRRKSVPASAVKAEVKRLSDEFEKSTGRRPPRAAMKELKADAVQNLMPHAFPKFRRVMVAFDLQAKRVYVECNGGATLDIMLSYLSAAMPQRNLQPLLTRQSLPLMVAGWVLEGTDPHGVEIGRRATLSGPERQLMTVRDTNMASLTDRIEAGMRPESVAMVLNQRVECVVDAPGELRNIKLLGIKDEKSDEAWAGAMLVKLTAIREGVNTLVDHCGGEGELPIMEAAAGTFDLGPEGGAKDEVYPQAKALVIEHGRASISLVQRHLRIGYNRAARMLEAMQAEGIVSAASPADGQRTVLASDADTDSDTQQSENEAAAS